MGFGVELRGTNDRLEKYFFSSKIWWSKFGGNKLTKWGKSIVLSNVNYFGKSCILIKNTQFPVRSLLSGLSPWYSTISKYSWGLLNHQIWRSNSIWKWSNQTSFFSELQLNLFGVFITKGDLIDFPHFVSLFSPNFDHQIFELKKYFSKRSFVPRSSTQKPISL